MFNFALNCSKLLILFCCANLQVVLTSTNPSEICVNGMSFSRRASKWANSALVVTVSSSDFGPFQRHGSLAGVEFQVLVTSNFIYELKININSKIFEVY